MQHLLEAIVLGIVQGLTEFLPVSSTAHLRIVPALFGWADRGAAFTAVIQCGTLVAVVLYFRDDLWRIGRAFFVDLAAGRPFASHEARLGWMMILATVPIVVIGLAFKDQIENEFRSLYVIIAALWGVAALLAVAEGFTARRIAQGHSGRTLEEATFGDAITVGLAQACALVPGTSRSGATILGGLARGLTREAAARFSFLLSLPAILAAGVFQLVSARASLLSSRSQALDLVIATVISFVIGYAAIALLLRYLRTHSTIVFVIYRFALGALLLWLLQTGRIESDAKSNESASQVTAESAAD
jgi:undecaprenyl-diphosphatase